MTVLAMVAVACGGGSEGLFITTAAPPIDLADLSAAAVAPEFLIIDEDSASPISMTIGFADNEQGVQSLVILGDKAPSTRPPDGMLIYVEDQAEPFDLTFDSEGRLLQIVAPDGVELRVLSYLGDQATVAAVGPDGTTEVVTVEVPEVDLSALDALAVPAGVSAVPAAYRAVEGVPPLSTVVATATGTYAVTLPDGLDASDVLLRAGGCSVPAISNVPATSSGTYVTCSTSIGTDQVVVRSTVDVPAFYGGEIPPVFFETRDACDKGGAATQGAGLLLLAGAVVVAVVSVVAAPVVGGVAGLVALLGVGSVSSFAGTVMGGTLIYIGGQPCTGAFTTNEGLRLDVEERLQGVSATVDFTPIVLKDPERYTAVAVPARLVFEPFGAAGSNRLDPLTVSVVPIVPIEAQEAAVVYSFSARLLLDVTERFEWVGTFSILDGALVGSGAVTGSVDQTCGIEGGDEYPVAYTASGSFDVTGTAGESTMLLALVPRGGNVDLTTGDASQFCVDLSIDVGQSMVDFPLGDVESGSLPIEVPIGGGQTSLDFGEGFVIEVTVAAN